MERLLTARVVLERIRLPAVAELEYAELAGAEPADSEQDSDEEEDEETEDDSDDEVKLARESDDTDDTGESGEDTNEPVDPSDLDWMSKHGKIVWSPTYFNTLRTFKSKCVTPELTGYATSRIDTIKSCFDLFMTDEILQLVLDMTNLHGRRSFKDWGDIDAIDLQAYVGLLLLAGVYRSRNEPIRNLWGEYTGRSVFRATMDHCMFSLINSNVRFDDKMTRPEREEDDRLAAFRDIWDKWTQRLPLFFNPGQDVCVGELFVPFKGRCDFRQCMPRKPVKYGIKMWVTCDAKTSYAWRMQIDTGDSVGAASEVNPGKRVVLNMTEGLKGHTVTCDHVFTSYALGKELLARNMSLVGAIRKNKPELPPILLQTQWGAAQTLFAFSRTHTAMSHIPRRGKHVLLLSTKHRASAVDQQRPEILTDYNSCKGGIDKLDKAVSSYSCRRSVSRWPMVLFYAMLNISAYNASVLWTALNPSWNKNKNFKERLFMEELGKILVAPQIQRRQRLSSAPAADATAEILQHSVDSPEESPDESMEPDSTTGHRRIRRKCVFCSRKKMRKSSNTCLRCGKYICKEHTLPLCRSCSHR